MNPKTISSEAEVLGFLNELRRILTSDEFSLDTDLDILLRKKGEDVTDPFTTMNTMLALSFDREDVRTELLSLTLGNYIETITDNKDSTLPPFFVFGKNISQRDLYIKVKIRDRKRGKVFCVSFHFARYPLSQQRPYP